jgi:DNA-directed RNA polymerase specialized sigma24 family protein
VAQKTLYDNYKKIVRDYLRSKYPNNSDLDDDVSEIMIKVFMNLAIYDPNKSKFKSWVLTIANNYMIDKWRSNQSQYSGIGTITVCSDPQYTVTVGYNGQISMGDISYSAGDVSFTTSNSNANVNGFNIISNGTFTACDGVNFENCSSINYISQQLSPQDFALLDMKYVQGYEYCEIGKEFNLTSNTVSNRVNYIKTKLKKSAIQEFHD